MNLINVVEQAFANEKVASYPKFKAGDTITVTYRIKEGDKERLQKFRGTVIQLRGASAFLHNGLLESVHFPYRHIFSFRFRFSAMI